MDIEQPDEEQEFLNAQEANEESMNLEESNEPEVDSISAKDVAFVRSAGGSIVFNGVSYKMQPFNSIRQMAAQKLGMEFLNMGEEALEEFQSRQTYNGIFWDAVVCVYLCLKPLSVATKAIDRTATVRKDAMNWAQAQKIEIGGEAHSTLIDAFGVILSDVMESIAEVDETGLPDGKDSLGES
tara:strand:- start:22975 stop:23523 length:549 start_codon:yes stop_codon:yes gene_type:complete